MTIILKPIITEKANDISELQNKYTFVVNKNANKIQIKDAVQEKYSVSVEKVNIMNHPPVKGLKYTKNGMQKSRISAYKKAVVKIAEGDSIDFYGNL